MILEISSDIFESSEVNDVDKLWHIIENRHFLRLRSESIITILKSSNWYEGLREVPRIIIDQLIIKASQMSKNAKTSLVVSNIGGESYSLKEAVRYLAQPLVVLLENSYNDSIFLKSLITHFKKEAITIISAQIEGLIEFGMGGGTSIPDVIKAKKDSFMGEVFTKEKHKYLRYFVIVDSDLQYPTMEIKQDKKHLIDFLNENEIPFHIFEKREMENYLPDDAFQEISDNRNYVEALLRLSPIQRDYIDLENGFPDKKFDSLEPAFQELFQSVDDEDKKVFRKCSLQKMNGEDRRNFKTEFPKLFLSKKVNRDNLLKRCNHHLTDANEIPNLLTAISNIL